MEPRRLLRQHELRGRELAAGPVGGRARRPVPPSSGPIPRRPGPGSKSSRPITALVGDPVPDGNRSFLFVRRQGQTAAGEPLRRRPRVHRRHVRLGPAGSGAVHGGRRGRLLQQGRGHLQLRAEPVRADVEDVLPHRGRGAAESSGGRRCRRRRSLGRRNDAARRRRHGHRRRGLSHDSRGRQVNRWSATPSAIRRTATDW